MKKLSAFILILAILLPSLYLGVGANTTANSVNVSLNNASHSVSDDMYGIFIEDINNAVEGGLCSNLVRNNSFEYTHTDGTVSGWSSNYDITYSDAYPMSENNKTCAVIPAGGGVPIKNSGFCEYFDYRSYDYNADKAKKAGMGVTENEKYDVSFYLVNTIASVEVFFEDDNGNHLSDISILTVSSGSVWQKYTATLTAQKTGNVNLVIRFTAKEPCYLDYVVVTPQSSYGYNNDEWKYTSLRSDLFELIKEMHPAFIRFPGGCVAEGENLENNFDWKSTIGPLEERKQNYNLWRSEVVDYNNSFQIGYHEYFQLCEDVGAKAVPILNVGLTCQGRNQYDSWKEKLKNGEINEEEWNAYVESIALTPGTDAWQSYVQDILDLIEYANGDVSTAWGAQRERNGHAESFNLQYIGLGNENWGDVFFRNFDALKAAVNAVYPEIKIISSSGPAADGEQFETSWDIISQKYTDTIVDEHYYRDDNWYLDNINRYDSYSRNGAKVFVGEYAATATGVGTISTKSNVKAAVAEAAYMTGLEKNGDVVVMASYAPFLAKLNAQNWTINLIWFNSHSVAPSPSYYNQMLFMNNTGNKYIDTKMPDGCDGLYQSATVDTENEILYIKLVNTTDSDKSFSYHLDGFDNPNNASIITLGDRAKGACNTVETMSVIPELHEASIQSDSVWLTSEKHSVNVIRIAYGKNTSGNGIWALPEMPHATTYYSELETVLIAVIPSLAIICGVTVLRIERYIKLKKKKK